MTTVRQLRSTPRPAVLAWVPVTDATGRTRLEMRWQIPGAPTARRAAA